MAMVTRPLRSATSASTDPAVFYVSFIIMYLHTSTTSTIVMLIYRISTKPDQLSSP